MIKCETHDRLLERAGLGRGKSVWECPECREEAQARFLSHFPQIGSNTKYLAGLDMKTPEGVAWNIVTTMIELPDGKTVAGHGWFESCAIRIADHIRAMNK